MGYRADSLRTWDFQGKQSLKQKRLIFIGSVDGKTWLLLRKHIGDTSLTDKWATHSWDISNNEKHQAFRYFRILQTGRNSSNHNFLVLSGIELYGDLYEWQDDE